MATISIPERVYPGFKIISELDDNQINSLVDYFSKMPVGKDYEEVEQDICQVINITNGEQLLKTIVSFSKLVDVDDVNYEDVSNNLTDSFIELKGAKPSKRVIENLRSNLLKILSNYKNLKYTIKTRELASENENNFGDFKLLTDIRLIFNDEIEDKNRYAVILHKLSIEFQKNLEIQELQLTVDLDDLKKLRTEIDKAILKDQVIRDDFKDSLNFTM